MRKSNRLKTFCARGLRCEPLEARHLLSNSAPEFVSPPTTELVVAGLVAPVMAASAPGDASRLFVAEVGSAGMARVKIVDLTTNTVLPTPFVTVTSVATQSGQGLLGLAFHPDYATNGRCYVCFTATGGTIVVREYTVSANPNELDPATARPIIQVGNNGNHNGGWLGFSPINGYLYITTGDGASGANGGLPAQDLNDRRGKLLRLDVDGDDFPADALRNYAVPPDNPFIAGGGHAEIFAYGLRNSFRAGFDLLTGDLYIGDVGGNTLEEVDFIAAASPGGQNFGWRALEGSLDNPLVPDPPPPNAVNPIHEYFHSGSPAAITGGIVYRGAALPQYQGKYFYADFSTNRIASFAFDGSAVSGLSNHTTEFDPPGTRSIGSITSIGEGVDGELYFTDLFGGELFRLKAMPDVLQRSATAVTEGSDVTISGSFLDLDLADSHTLSVDWGDGTLETIPLVQGARSFSVVHHYSDDVPLGTSSDLLAISATINDDAMQTCQASTSVTVDNVPPSASAGGPYAIIEEDSLLLDAGLSSDVGGAADPLSYSWDINGDLVFGDAVGLSPLLDWNTLVGLGIVPGEPYKVCVEVSDDDGGITISAPTTLMVTALDRQAPRITAGVVLTGSLSVHDEYSVPTGSGEQLRTVPVGAIDTLQLTFDEDVVVDAGHLTLTGPSGVVPTNGFNYEAMTRSAQWTLAAPLDAGIYTLTVADEVTDLTGNSLDGEWENPDGLDDPVSATISGDGSAGGDFDFLFTVLPGDASRDNLVSGGDFTIWGDHFDGGTGSGDATFAQGDFTGDGFVTGADFTLWANHFSSDLRDPPQGIFVAGERLQEAVQAIRTRASLLTDNTRPALSVVPTRTVPTEGESMAAVDRIYTRIGSHNSTRSGAARKSVALSEHSFEISLRASLAQRDFGLPPSRVQ